MVTERERVSNTLVVSDVRGLADARRLADETARALGVPADRLLDVRLVVSELVTNALEHGSGDVHVEVGSGPAGLEIAVASADSGSIPTKTLEAPDSSNTRGRGLFIVASTADAVTIVGERGTIAVRCTFAVDPDAVDTRDSGSQDLAAADPPEQHDSRPGG